MHATLADLGFPLWLRTAHWINAFFIGLMVRSGIQILGSYPRLFWNDHSTPGTEWMRFTKRLIPRDRLWTSLEEEQEVSPLIGQPGGNSLGHGRHWHFFSLIFWVLSGVVYVILLFVTGEWQRLIPTSWSIVPAAVHTFTEYATFHVPPASEFHPYDPLQQLTYAAVVFLLGPFLIASGAAQSPAIEARFPWYSKLWGGRQSARSLHFLGLVAVVGFTLVHTALVVITGLGRNLGDIILGQHDTNQGLAIGLGLGLIAAIFLFYGVSSWLNRRYPRQFQHVLGAFIRPILRQLSISTTSRQHYSPTDISPFFTLNGNPPDSPEYLNQLWHGFRSYHLEVKGLVHQPLNLSLEEIKSLPKQQQITKHNCIQGWTGIAEWGGVSMAELLKRCGPLPNARFVVFWSYSNDTAGKPFYEALPIEAVLHPQTILAYEMNYRPLPMPHGAPLRLRVETHLGFKMTKWVRCIELVENYATIREGQGGSREDDRYNEVYASA